MGRALLLPFSFPLFVIHIILEDKMLVLFEWIYRTKWLDNAKMSRMIGVIVNNRQESEYFRGTFLTVSVLM